jgi:hypothetical protein
VSREVPLGLKIKSENIVDQKHKKQIISKVIFNNRKLQSEENMLFNNLYLNKNIWDIDTSKTEVIRDGMELKSKDGSNTISMIKITIFSDYLELLLPLVLARP